MSKPQLRPLFLGVLLAGTSLLAGCIPFVHYPHPDFVSKETAVGTAAGASVGTMISTATTSGIASPGLGIGALAGAIIGTAYNSPGHWLKKFQQEGITVIQTGQLVKIVIPSDKVFVIDSDSILPHSYPMLAGVIQFIQNYGPVNLTINGYTDNVGSPLNDYKLSLAQAKSIKGFFWSHGIPSNHLKAIGHGQADPIAANYTPTGSYYNRRIEIDFAYG